MAKAIEDIIVRLFNIEAIRFGEFKLKTGLMSPIYFNLRVIIGYPDLLKEVSNLLWEASKSAGAQFDLTCGVPYTALPIATCMSLDYNIPMVIRRKEAKDYGTRQMIEGVFKEGQSCLIIEDVVTSGGSVLETVEELQRVNLKVQDAVVLLDRNQGGKDRLAKNNIKLHSVLDIDIVLDTLLSKEKISKSMYDKVRVFLKDNQFTVAPQNTEKQSASQMTYKQRANLTKNPVAQRIFSIMEDKKTNLVFSVDVTSCSELLRLADSVGPHICILKTHIDMLSDFSSAFTKELSALAQKHNFVIFEDRKFADIGNTVVKQYAEGIYRIKEWADLTNAHSVPGKGVIEGLQKAASGCSRAALLIAQMSSKGSLTNDSYSKATLEMAKESNDFVIGFICTSKISDDPKFIHMTPGVNLNTKGDGLGQQYLTPFEVISNRGCDAIIVGRGIYSADDPVQSACLYKEEGYKAYRDRLN